LEYRALLGAIVAGVMGALSPNYDAIRAKLDDDA